MDVVLERFAGYKQYDDVFDDLPGEWEGGGCAKLGRAGTAHEDVACCALDGDEEDAVEECEEADSTQAMRLSGRQGCATAVLD